MTPHLRGHVRAYVDRALPPALLHVYDRHLVYCRVCQSAADQERRIVLALRSHTDIPTSLRSSLMGLAVSTPAMPTTGLGQPPRAAAGPEVPPVPEAPPGSLVSSHRMHEALHDRLPTVRPTAPALHRSPVRAAVVASIAAGASVAAAWGLAVAPLQGSTRPVEAQAPAGVASMGSVAFGISSLAATGFMVGSSSRFSASTPKARTTGRGPSSGTTASYWVVSPQVYAGYDRNAVAPVRMSLGPSAQSTP
ncbi:hypothetical protein BA895_04255 [Humibacillus sp. DSM 29435]|uniref:hypothetical protein n=1 Tax=Humibacillus sp. DSM 29435 TaxID=1869167 RepID=UPI0008732EDF|nr:hypothetical protein [Humibacillus sp. DSM 29435]OFE16785.1 hypothetical protein BA895_04255 [Humibacillus sp. DSM 29435]